jgi:hypothetical protein
MAKEQRALLRKVILMGVTCLVVQRGNLIRSIDINIEDSMVAISNGLLERELSQLFDWVQILVQ